jgi:transcriptional regulator with XRE-family HTH domain
MTSAPQIHVPHPARGYAALVGPFLLLLIPGTGGAYALENVVQLERWSFHRAVEIRRERQRASTDARTAAERLSQIRERLGLNMSELATVLHVSRPTAYAWMNGQPPQADGFARVLRLSAVADQFTDVPAKRIDSLLRQRLFDGRSLLDLLESESDTSAALPHFVELVKVAPATRAPMSSGRHVRPVDESDAFSTPGTYEPS